MDGREGDEGPTAGERPLTRRELRAARAAADTAPDQPAQGSDASTGPREADSWEAAIGWALRGELPAALPPEPVEPDDVRWEPELLDDQAPRALPPEPADDRRPWTAGSGLWDELVRSGEANGPAEQAEPSDEGDQGDQDGQGQPRRVSVFGAAGGPGKPPGYVGGGLVPGGRSTWTPTDVVPTQVGEPVVPTGAADDTLADDALVDDALVDDALVDEDTHERARTAPRGVPVVPVSSPHEPVVSEPPPPEPALAEPGPLPTLDDLMATRAAPADGPAEWGWRAFLRRATGGLVAPEPGPAERAERAAVASVQRPLDGPRTIVVINPKGGAHKTTATLLLAATFGRLRGGYTLAWDNNETRGTLGWRSRHTHHARTAVDLLEDLERFTDPASSRVGDLDAYVRSQASAQFDVLASDEDAASAASVDAFAFRALHRTLLRFYRVLVVDTGNNMRASNWQAALEAADQVVVVSTMREDTAQSAAWMLDALRATGHEDAVRRAVTVLSQPGPRTDAELTARLHDHFGRLTRTVLEVPYEPALVAGGPIDYESLSEATRRAWLRVAAACADGLERA